MSPSVLDLAFRIPSSAVTPTHQSFRPPHWPPPTDWPVSFDANGNVLSTWGQPRWDFSYWAGRTLILDFAGGRHASSGKPLSLENQEVLRLLTTWMMWGPRGPGSWNTLKGNFYLVRRLAVLCEQQGISLRDLERYPLVINKAANLAPSSQERSQMLLVLDRLQQGKDVLGLCVLGQSGLANLAQAYLNNPLDDETEQTAYIPPRIWFYQNRRLRECLEDFLNHENDIKSLYQFCVDGYAVANSFPVNAALSDKEKKGVSPFDSTRAGKYYLGTFSDAATNYRVNELLNKWVGRRGGEPLTIKQFSGYLSLVQIAAITFIANFTLQRKEEAAELRADCLLWENDSIVGRVAVIRGETTKTDPDSDARWPTSPSVEIAVQAAASVASLRMSCALSIPEMLCTAYDVQNPYLLHAATDPWTPSSSGVKPYSIRPQMPNYRAILKRFPKLMDMGVLRITEDDLVKARMFTPNLDKGGEFAVGNVWPLAHHQLRRTGGVNMFASGLVSDGSVQVTMKHLTLLQSAYYGQNFSKVRFNEDIEGITNAAKYEVMAKQIEALVSERFVSPLGASRKEELVVNLISEKNFRGLVKAAEKGEVSFRETRLGGCTKRGHCDYGGIESIARCAGGDGDKPCRESIFDKAKRPAIQLSIEKVENRLQSVTPGSPRAKALHNELSGMRNFLNVTRD